MQARICLCRRPQLLKASLCQMHRQIAGGVRGQAGGEADLARCEVRHADGTREPLSEREIAVLRYLAGNPGRAISREEILLRVWRLPANASATRTIDVHVANLRAKLRDDPTDPKVILTVRGKGYMLGQP